MKSALKVSFAVCLILTSGACRHIATSMEPPAESVRTISLDASKASPATVSWAARSDYIAVNVPFDPIAAVKKQIEERESIVLKSRGEAHITVVTPQELTVLRTRLSLEQINGAVEKMSIQSIPIQLQCLGRGQLRQHATYFVVVKAPGLSTVREKLRQQFVAAGGEKQAFGTEAYYPHITVGFTDRDLHAADGVLKDARNCAYQLAKPE